MIAQIYKILQQIKNLIPVSSAGSIEVISAGYTVIGDGRKEVALAGTREALAASTPCKAVLITAETNNTGTIVVGATGTVVAALATRRGTPLQAGESVMIPVSNLNLVFLDTTVNTDGVTDEYFG